MYKLDLESIIKSSGFPLLLRGILDRVPVIMACKDPGFAELLVQRLSNMFTFRSIIQYPAEITSQAEVEDILYLEQNDNYTQRTIFSCDSDHLESALHEFKNFAGWIVPARENQVEDAKVILTRMGEPFIITEINMKKNALKSVVAGVKRTEIADTSHEKAILKNVFQMTDTAIGRLYNYLRDDYSTLKKEANWDRSDLRNYLDLTQEKNEIQLQLLSKALNNFYIVCLIAHTIYLKAEYLNNLGIPTSFSDSTILSAMRYKLAPIERVNYFISKEWKID